MELVSFYPKPVTDNSPKKDTQKNRASSGCFIFMPHHEVLFVGTIPRSQGFCNPRILARFYAQEYSPPPAEEGGRDIKKT